MYWDHISTGSLLKFHPQRCICDNVVSFVLRVVCVLFFLITIMRASFTWSSNDQDLMLRPTAKMSFIRKWHSFPDLQPRRYILIFGWLELKFMWSPPLLRILIGLLQTIDWYAVFDQVFHNCLSRRFKIKKYGFRLLWTFCFEKFWLFPGLSPL